MMVADIRRAVAEHYRLSEADLVGPSHKRALAWPRHVAYALAQDMTGKSLRVIGRAFGNRHHSTVHVGIANARRQPELRAAETAIAETLSA